MPTVHYYGRKTSFVGKTLFEILANLRNFGVNRMLIKQEELLKNPGKRSYYIVKKVEPVMDKNLNEGAMYAERVFNGAKVPGLVFVEEESWHTDWQLIPKHEEDQYRIKPEELTEHGTPETVEVLPRWMEVPPLMKIFLDRHFKARKGATIAPVKLDSNSISIKMHYHNNQFKVPHMQRRVAEEGEESSSTLNRPIKTLLMDQFKPSNAQTDNATQSNAPQA